MLIQKTVFQGTPEEFQTVRSFFAGIDPVNPDRSVEVSVTDAASSNREAGAPVKQLELNSRVVETAFNRIPLSKSQKRVLKAILDAGEAGTISSEIASSIGLTRQELAGVMGAFGRRVANTAGWPKGAELFEYEWDDDNNQWRYWLPAAVREALSSGAVGL